MNAEGRPSSLIAGLIAAALAATPSLAQAPKPAASDLERSGWTLVTASEGVYVYMKSAEAARSDGVRRVWTAYDSERPRDRMGFSFMSVESLGEFDCRRNVSRVVEEHFHAERGLKGQTWRQPNFIPTDWAMPEPESVGAVRMAFACKALNAI
jgi:hypothetical protein